MVRGRDDSLRQQQIVTYGQYELPFGRNKMFLSNVNTLVNEVVTGWQLSPVLNYSSGLPFTLSYGECNLSIPGDAPCYVNGNPRALQAKPSGLPGKNLTFYKAQTLGGAVPAAGPDQIGDTGRNSIFGPHYFNLDLSLQKNFPIKENIVAQFRVDAFNALNHINFGNPGGNVEQDGSIGCGVLPNCSSGPRQLQFSLRAQF